MEIVERSWLGCSGVCSCVCDARECVKSVREQECEYRVCGC